MQAALRKHLSNIGDLKESGWIRAKAMKKGERGRGRERGAVLRLWHSSPSQYQSGDECQHKAWAAGWRCAPLPPSPSYLTTPHVAAGPGALPPLGTGLEPQAGPAQGAQREETCKEREVLQWGASEEQHPSTITWSHCRELKTDLSASCARAGSFELNLISFAISSLFFPTPAARLYLLFHPLNLMVGTKRNATKQDWLVKIHTNIVPEWTKWIPILKKKHGISHYVRFPNS